MVCVCVCVCGSLAQGLFDSPPSPGDRALGAIQDVGNRGKSLAFKDHLHQQSVGWGKPVQDSLKPLDAVILMGL